MILYSDPMKYMTHLSEKHGADSVLGMAKMLEWTTGPSRALGRFEARTPPKTLDEMYACATNESERRAIHEMLFGSAMDVIDRNFPEKDKYAPDPGGHAGVPGDQLDLPRPVHPRAAPRVWPSRWVFPTRTPR